MPIHVDNSVLVKSDDWEPMSRRALVLGDFGLWAAPDILSGEARLAHPVPDDDAVEDLLRVSEAFKRLPAECTAVKWMVVMGADPRYSGRVELREVANHLDCESHLFRTLGTMTSTRFVNSPTTGIWRLLRAVHAWTCAGSHAEDSSEAMHPSSSDGDAGTSENYLEERGEYLTRP